MCQQQIQQGQFLELIKFSWASSRNVKRTDEWIAARVGWCEISKEIWINCKWIMENIQFSCVTIRRSFHIGQGLQVDYIHQVKSRCDQIPSLSFKCRIVDDDEVCDEYANCKPSSTGESFCKKKSDKCIPDQPSARNCDGHAGDEDDRAFQSYYICKCITTLVTYKKKRLTNVFQISPVLAIAMVTQMRRIQSYNICKCITTIVTYKKNAIDKYIPDQPGARNCHGHAGEEDDCASSELWYLQMHHHTGYILKECNWQMYSRSAWCSQLQWSRMWEGWSRFIRVVIFSDA